MPFGQGIPNISQTFVSPDGRITQAWRQWLLNIGRGILTIVAGAGGGITIDTTPDEVIISITPTGVTAGTYGDATHVGQFTVNNKGQLTFAQNVAIDAISAAGLGLFAEGLLSAGELLGGAVFAVDMVFTDSDPFSDVTCIIPAAADAVLRIVDARTNLQIGTVTFPAGNIDATIAWSTDPYTLAADTPVYVYAPNPADASLASVAGKIAGNPT